MLAFSINYYGLSFRATHPVELFCAYFCVVTLFYQTAIDHVYFYEIEFVKLIIRPPI